MELRNKYLNQSNFLTRSVLNTKREIHKDIIYLIQSKIDFFGEPRDIISISLNDYLIAKNVKKNNTYSFAEFHSFTEDINSIRGAFYNRINSSFINFNIVDNVQIDSENVETLKIKLASFGKIFFYKKCLEEYIKEVTPKGRDLKYIGHTQIDNNSFKIKGKRRKKFFEIISQFRNTGFCKITVLKLKMYLGYIEFIDKTTNKKLNYENQLQLIFFPEDTYELIDRCPNYSYFERDFLKPAIVAINKDVSIDINNLVISKKLKTGRKITHLEFKFNPLGKDLNAKEKECLKIFESLNLDKNQVIFLLKRIGHEEMYRRWVKFVDKKIYEDSRVAKYYERKNGKEILNIVGYLYKVVFPELKTD